MSIRPGDTIHLQDDREPEQVTDGRFSADEVRLATRNKGMPLEALRYDITPTGMHYGLIHFDVPAVSADDWRLRLGGQVRSPLALSLEDLQDRETITRTVTMECAGNGRALMKPRYVTQPWFLEAVGTAQWDGIRLRDLLDAAGLRPEAREVLFTGFDRGLQGEEVQNYQRSLPLEECLRDDVLLAWAMNGRPLEPQHGFPLRLVVPGWYGMTSVKWLSEIEVLATAFRGFQMERAYRFMRDKDDSGAPVTRMRVRALMIPPGMPDFKTRQRLIAAGEIELRGRAWSGEGEIMRVEVSTDGGESWIDADLEPADSRHAWTGWRGTWHALPGRHVLVARATDAAGNQQPLDPPWNFQGMGNNAVQRVEVCVIA